MRKFCKGMVIFAHTKISAAMLGGIMLIWATLPFASNESLLVRYLNFEDACPHWIAMMGAPGFLLVLGSVLPMRSMRHIGLALCCLVMFAFGGYFFMWELFTPVTVLMPYLGLMALITLMAETKAKPRMKTVTGKKSDDCP